MTQPARATTRPTAGRRSGLPTGPNSLGFLIRPAMKRICCLVFPILSLIAVRSVDARPNFVVIFTDDQTYRAIGYNNPQVKTPALDRLAADGVIFDHAYIASPICGASRASMMTGLFPQQHGCVALNTGSFIKNVSQEKYRTLPQYLRKAGYLTALFGKSNLGDPQAYGFQKGQQRGDARDRASFEFAKKFVAQRANDKQSFLLWLAPRQPHVPLIPNQKWLDLYDVASLDPDPNYRESPSQVSFFNQGIPGQHYYRDSEFTQNWKGLSAGPPRSEEVIRDFTKAYYATISHLDHQIGEVVTQLKITGLYDDTVIIFLSDNGYHLGNHGLGNKITMHEESVRVPMFICYRKLIPANTRSDALVSSLDVLPTILALAGVELPHGLSGKSLLSVLTNPKQKVREYVASECVGLGGKLGTGHRMVRTKRWKYMLSGTGEEALFDQQNDVYEQTNLAKSDEHHETLNSLRAAMSEWMDDVNDGHDRPPGT